MVQRARCDGSHADHAPLPCAWFVTSFRHTLPFGTSQATRSGDARCRSSYCCSPDPILGAASDPTTWKQSPTIMYGFGTKHSFATAFMACPLSLPTPVKTSHIRTLLHWTPCRSRLDGGGLHTITTGCVVKVAKPSSPEPWECSLRIVHECQNPYFILVGDHVLDTVNAVLVLFVYGLGIRRQSRAW
jgi:hypothetical protein